MRQPPTGTVTFLFTDIEGSTRLWEERAEAMRPALARHDALLRQTIVDHDGCVFKTVGDAFCAAFSTAPDALRAALASQQALGADAWAEGARLRVRMALHTGAAEERDGDYFGPPLNRVARLLAAAHGGQTLLSLAAQELIRDDLPADAALRDLGEARLKDLSRPERVFQLLHPALVAQFPPLRTLASAPNNLPQQPTSFIGREKELADVKALLAKTRLLTLVGAGGAGKTRLALQAAADLLDGEGDGVWLIELAALSDPALVPQAVADALGVREEAGRPISRTLAEWLRSRRLLLILDNCEHLVAACAALAADLLRSCPGVHLLASSREALNVPGETVYRVPSLSLPDSKRMQTAESLSQYEAVRLFIDRAQAVQAAFAVSDANAPAVAQVCVHLDGIPLAIELAAARVRSLSVEAINARLDQRFRLLTGGSRVALPRQQTLRALIDWSYDLLAVAEKVLLLRLSVFAGGWTLAAAEAVCAGGVEDWEVLDLLTSLADKSLVSYEEGSYKEGAGEEGAGGAAGRYRLLETIRQYAQERLAEAGDNGAVCGRHRDYFLALAHRAAAKSGGPEQTRWFDGLEADHDNLRAALDFFQQAAGGWPEEAALGMRMAAALLPFWRAHGHLREGADRCACLLEATPAAPATAARALALNALGVLAMLQSDYALAEAAHGEARAICLSLGERREEAAALQGLGNAAFYTRSFAAARAFYEDSLALRETDGDAAGVAACCHSLGNLALRQERLGEAAGLFERALGLRRLAGDTLGVATTLGAVSQLRLRQGEWGAAAEAARETLRLFDRAGQHWLAALNLDLLSHVSSNHGWPARAVRLLAASEAVRERFNFRRPQAEEADHEERVADLRAQVGEVEFQRAWASGLSMPWENVIGYAMIEED